MREKSGKVYPVFWCLKGRGGKEGKCKEGEDRMNREMMERRRALKLDAN